MASGRGRRRCCWLPEVLTPRCGLRPNSPTATTSVSFSRPRSSRSSIRADRPASSIGADWFFIRFESPTWTSHEWLSLLATFGQIDLDEPRAGFDQPAGQQAALAERVLAVPFADLGLLLAQVEGVLRPGRETTRPSALS